MDTAERLPILGCSLRELWFFGCCPRRRTELEKVLSSRPRQPKLAEDEIDVNPMQKLFATLRET